MAGLIRSVVRDLLPPALVRLLRPISRQGRLPPRISFEGDYIDWQTALENSTGYDDAAILERVDAASSRVVEGKAAFDRDGVTFERLDPPLPLIAGLFRAAAERDGALRGIL